MGPGVENTSPPPGDRPLAGIKFRYQFPDANFSVGSDVGGGTGLSMLHTCAEGFKVAHLAGFDWHPFEALWSITKGNADALGLGHSIGQLRPGFFADMVLLDLDQPRALGNRLEHCENLPDELFALISKMTTSSRD